MALDVPPLLPYNAPMKKESFNANLDSDMLEWLRQEASRRRCSMNQILRDLILAAMLTEDRRVDGGAYEPAGGL